jgi:hypothetical protein
MLNQELRALGVALPNSPVSSWKNVLRDSGNKLIKEEVHRHRAGQALAGSVARACWRDESRQQ